MISLIAGNRSFLEDCAFPTIEELESSPAFSPPEGYVQEKKEPRFFASAFDAPGLLVPIMFVGAWAANKVLDELYDFVLPTIKKRLISYTEKQQKLYVLSFVLSQYPAPASIFIVAVGKTQEDLQASESLITKVVPAALARASKSTRKEYHVYLIEAGKVDVEPSIYESLEQAIHSLSLMRPSAPPKTIGG